LVKAGKYTAFEKLCKMHELYFPIVPKDMSLKQKGNFIYLGYMLNDPKQKKIPLEQKLENMGILNYQADSIKDNSSKLSYYPGNTKYSFAFVWGFFLGDGHFSIRVRKDKGFYFIPIFQITQSETPSNTKLMNEIAEYLESIGCTTYITIHLGRLVLKVEGKKNIKIIQSYIFPSLKECLF